MTEAVLLNIGNTHSEFALWAQALGERGRIPTDSLLAGELPALLHNHRNLPWFAACVVPQAAAQLATVPTTMHWLDGSCDLRGIDTTAVDRSTVGADRLANALAAAMTLDLPAVVIDCGTAITTEVVDAQRRFLGGAILPGRHLQARALNAETAQLPMAEPTDELPTPCAGNTQDALRAGIDFGVLGAVSKLVEQYRRKFDQPELKATVVGGDAEFFAHHLGNMVNRGPVDFTLIGLACYAQGRLTQQSD